MSFPTLPGDETQVSNVTKPYYYWEGKAVNTAWNKTHTFSQIVTGCERGTGFPACPMGQDMYELCLAPSRIHKNTLKWEKNKNQLLGPSQEGSVEDRHL